MTHYDAFIVELNKLLDMNHAQLLKCDYFKKIFGNIVLEIKYQNKVHMIVSDRREIYLDNLMICNSDHIKGQADIYQKILEVIKDKIFI